MILHILWSGSFRGGAQNVAIELSKRYLDLYTSSFCSGNLSSFFSQKGLKFTKNWHFALVKSKIVIASDYRAICLVLLFRLVYFRSFTVVGVIHSNRRTKLDYFAKKIFKLLRHKDIILVTTVGQREYLASFATRSLLQICRIHAVQYDITKKNTSGRKNVMFFGRVTLEKCVTDYTNAVKAISDPDRKYYVFGPIGNISESRLNGPNVILNDGWHDLERVVDKYQIGYVVVPNPDEGVSLITLECIELGILPITRANSAFDTLGLPDMLRWSEGISLCDAIFRIEGSRERLLRESQQALLTYQNAHLSLNTLIGNLIDEASTL